VGAKLIHADVRTDMTKLAVDFRNSSQVPKNLPLFTDVYHLQQQDALRTEEWTSYNTEDGGSDDGGIVSCNRGRVTL
jgi:hypothetical protein